MLIIEEQVYGVYRFHWTGMGMLIIEELVYGVLESITTGIDVEFSLLGDKLS